MTHVIQARNVNDALLSGLDWLQQHGLRSDSRVGKVLVSPTPVITEYDKPCERVLFNEVRDANPFFHLMESLWMLDGRNDVKFPAYYASNIASFSDDGSTIPGAYGNRWRDRFGYDQLPIIIKELKNNPDSRRCVLAMWDAGSADEFGGKESDLHLAVSGGKDVPCNTQAYFDTLGGSLNMTVTCRSNDIIWGCYGANAVHFSILHEYVALAAGLEQGVYRQFSNNYHMYAERPDVVRLVGALETARSDEKLEDDYIYGSSVPYALINTDLDTWHEDMTRFFGEWAEGVIMTQQFYVDSFWANVVVPLVNAHHYWKQKDFTAAKRWAAQCEAVDWSVAAERWLERRGSKQ